MTSTFCVIFRDPLINYMQFISCQITTKCDDLIHTPQTPQSPRFVVISVLFLWWFQYFLMYELQNELTHFLDIFCIIQLMSFKLRIWNIYVKLGIMIWLILLQTVSGATKVWRFYVSATSATYVALVWRQKAASHIVWVYLVLFNWWASKWLWAE